MDIDPKSIKILKAKYWSNGWVDSSERILTESDARHLSNTGWDLGCINKSHDDLVTEIAEMSQNISLKECASMLSQSILTRKLHDRSFLSSATQALMIPMHTHVSDGACPICGLYRNEEVDQDVMLFEKIMWGGVRLTNLQYVWLDLKILKGQIRHESNCEALLELLRSIDIWAEGLSASKFAASLKDVKGNKAEREVLCGILAVCDILQHPEYHGFLENYRSVSEREMPNQHYIDLEWPYCWYNSKFGVNMGAVEAVTQKNG